MREKWDRYGWLVAFFVLPLAVAIAFYGPGAALHLVEGWQTLIAGMLAILAAWWTVRETRRNHEQLMELNVRHDRLKIERAIVHVVPALNTRIFMLGMLVNTYSHLPPDLANRADVAKKRLIEIKNSCKAIKKVLADPALVGAEGLFPGSLSSSIQSLKRNIASYLESVKNRLSQEHLTQASAAKQQLDDMQITTYIRRFERTMGQMAFETQSLVDELFALGKQYKIEIPRPGQQASPHVE